MLSSYHEFALLVGLVGLWSEGHQNRNTLERAFLYHNRSGKPSDKEVKCAPFCLHKSMLALGPFSISLGLVWYGLVR